MKIKIRPDGTGAPGSSEWAAMNEWLAELREDDEIEPASEDETGTDSEDEPVRSNYAEPGSDGYARPGSESYTTPGSENNARPARESYTTPGSDGYTTPGSENNAGPARGYTGPRAPGDTEPDTSGYVPPARKDESGVTPGAAVPLNGYASRTSAGTRATASAPVRAPLRAPARAPVTTPAEAPLVRALIGDELRTPTAWCEMSSCISWHADRSALGEADIRARAIGAGWRIDALGRLACPRCQQTSSSFRATRPVVPWDRTTAIMMAARATARGNHPGGPAAATNGHGTRRPAPGLR